MRHHTLDFTGKFKLRILVIVFVSLLSNPIAVSAKETQLLPQESKGIGSYAVEDCTFAGEHVSREGLFATSSPMRLTTLACRIGPMSTSSPTTFTLKFTVTDIAVGEEMYSYEKKYEVFARPQTHLSYPVTVQFRDIFLPGSYRAALVVREGESKNDVSGYAFNVSVGGANAEFSAIDATALSFNAGELITIHARGKFTNDEPHILSGVIRSGTEYCSAVRTEKFTNGTAVLKIFIKKECPSAYFDAEILDSINGIRVARARGGVALLSQGTTSRIIVPSVILLLAVSIFIAVERQRFLIKAKVNENNNKLP